jgi:hypothetical protein
MTSVQPVHLDETITRPIPWDKIIAWDKMSFPQQLEMFQFLQSKCQLTVQDCEDLIASLENTHLKHLLDTDVPPDPNFIQVIKNAMTEIRLVQLNLADFAEFAEIPQNQVDFEAVLAQNDTGGYAAMIYDMVKLYNSTDSTNRSIHMEEKWVSISINGIKKHIQNEELLFFTGNYDLEQVKVQLQSRFQGKGKLIFNS